MSKCEDGIRLKFSDGYPACVNDGNCAEAVLSAARTFLPGELVGPPTPNMAGEDFAFFLSRKVLQNSHDFAPMDHILLTQAHSLTKARGILLCWFQPGHEVRA